MKAIILAGGRGTRGKPYTEFFPKAMTPIDGKPMIDYVIRYLQKFNFIKEIIIIADFNGLGGQIKNYYGDKRTSPLFKTLKVEPVEICYILRKNSKGNQNLYCGL